jgi:glycerol-1-phosphate dehydrogenase [NAD(P)+]
MKWQTKDELRATLTDAKARWPQIRERLARQLVPSAEIERRLKAVGAPSRPEEIGVANDFALKNVRFAMFMRNRYNILDFAFRIGRLDDFARAAAFVM